MLLLSLCRCLKRKPWTKLSQSKENLGLLYHIQKAEFIHRKVSRILCVIIQLPPCFSFLKLCSYRSVCVRIVFPHIKTL